MKIISAVSTVLIIVLLVSGCSGAGENADPTDMHSIRYDLPENMQSIFLETPESAKAGDTVLIRAASITDSDIRVYAGGKEIRKQWSEDGYTMEFTFIMPGSDIDVSAEWIGLGLGG